MAMNEDLKKLSEENILVAFNNQDEMFEFLIAMDKSDERIPIRTKDVRTKADERGIFLCDTEGHEYPCMKISVSSLEERSGDNAMGHSMMTVSQVMSSMNNYWPLHSANEEVVAHIRGGKVIQLESSSYNPFEQHKLFEAVEDTLNAYGDNSFIRGHYMHEETCASWRVDAIPETFSKAWKYAGLPETMLNSAYVSVTFVTADLANQAAKVITTLNVAGQEILAGVPTAIVHRKGKGSVEAFSKNIQSTISDAQEELKDMSELMKVTVKNPEGAIVWAMKSAGIPSISKKAYKELIEDSFFCGPESAYMLYMQLFGLLRTKTGSDLSEDRKFRIMLALRKLLKADWTKFDKPAPANI